MVDISTLSMAGVKGVAIGEHQLQKWKNGVNSIPTRGVRTPKILRVTEMWCNHLYNHPEGMESWLDIGKAEKSDVIKYFEK